MKKIYKINQIIFSEGQAEITQERIKIRMRDIFKKIALLALRKMKFDPRTKK